MTTPIVAICACSPAKLSTCPVHDSGRPVDESDWWTDATGGEVYHRYLEAGFTEQECTPLLFAWIVGRVESGG